MALYREGKAAMAADGTVTGTGTKWQSSLSLIRPGATIMFLSSPIQMAVVNKVVSDTEIKAITTKGAVVASSDYAILLSDSLTVDGLAQDVAETLRYYQSQETVIADAVEFFKTFDFESLQNLANQIKADSEAAGASATAAAESESKAKTSETNAKSSENAAKTSEVAAETARDQVQQIIDNAGDQSTLVALAQPQGSDKVNTSLNVTVGNWLKNTVITPNMFHKPTDADWLPAFQAAAEESRRLGLPATLIPAVEYTFRSKVDLAMFPNGIVSGASRNNKVVLKAVANINNDEVFVSMKNVDRRKTGGFIILANNLYDVAFDTTWDLTGGPSLMMTWEKIQIEGWRKIGWRANNNNDVWNKNITVLGPGADATPDCVSYYNHSAGGPISFEGCSFAGGRIKVTAQHISASHCVFRGVEIKDGGSGWNTFAGIGCHFFKDTYYNACFRFAGNVQGFSVIGGLVEPTDGGIVLLGASASGQGYLNCGQLEFINTRISSYSSSSPAVLASGTMVGAYGKKRICIRGGFAELASYDPSSMGWVDELLCEQVLLNQQSTSVTTRLFTTTGLNHRESAVIRNMHRAKFDSTGCLVTGMCTTLSSTGRNFGNIGFLSGANTQVSAGRIRVAYSDGGGYAEYTYQRTGANAVTLTLVNSAFSSSDRTLNVYTSGSTLVYISNDRPAGSAGDNWTVLVEYSGYLDYTP